MACRVTRAPSDSAVADSAPPAPSFRTTESRVSSPRAKKTSAAARSLTFDILPQVALLPVPAGLVHSEGARTPVFGDAIKARFDDGERGVLAPWFQAKL